jgi:transposase
MAVTRDGIPVRVWSWPGNTAGSALIRQVRDDIREWTLSRVIWVADRGFASAQNRRPLMRGGGGYIIGEKLRSGSAEARAALSRQGRYATVTGNMQVKEVSIGADDRFIICYNPAQAERDAAIRAKMTARLEEAIKDTDQLDAAERAKIEGALSGKQGLKRFLRVTSGGLLRVDKAKVKAEENLDGKYLLHCSDPDLSAEDIAVGYKQLLEVERGWRDMKQVLDLRPVYHRREDRIRRSTGQSACPLPRILPHQDHLPRPDSAHRAIRGIGSDCMISLAVTACKTRAVSCPYKGIIARPCHHLGR